MNKKIGAAYKENILYNDLFGKNLTTNLSAAELSGHVTLSGQQASVTRT